MEFLFSSDSLRHVFFVHLQIHAVINDDDDAHDYLLAQNYYHVDHLAHVYDHHHGYYRDDDDAQPYKDKIRMLVKMKNISLN